MNRTQSGRSAANWTLLYRLIGRPMLREPLRTVLTFLCVSVGVAVVVAIDLAGEASAGSFRSSMETLQGSASYEIRQVGGIPETVLADLVTLREPLQFSPRVEGFATVPETGERVPLFGVDLLGDGALHDGVDLDAVDPADLTEGRPVWVSSAMETTVGRRLDLLVGDRLETFLVRGVLGDAAFQSDSLGAVVLMDISVAQQSLGRVGLLDRIYVQTPEGSEADWSSTFRDRVPQAASVEPVGVSSRENRKLLQSFRWNLRILSYIALIVGAFLVYNTISVSVVRRRHVIGLARALGMSAWMVRAGFLAEGALFGAIGTCVGLLLGRAMAVGAVELMGSTVQSLYVSSSPGEIAIRPWTLLVAAAAGIGTSVASAWWPAREAASVPPSEAMARARLDYQVLSSSRTWALRGVACAGVSAALCLVPPWDRIPYAAYLAALGMIGSATMLVPHFSETAIRLASRPLLRAFGIAPMLGARTLSGSLARTAVIVAALSTATAMMVSVAIMVGSMRDTLLIWMDSQLQADLYVQPEAGASGLDGTTMTEAAAVRIESLPTVRVVDRFRSYPISFGGLPASLALADFNVIRTESGMKTLEGPPIRAAAERLTQSKSVIVSEAFSSKHDVHVGDTLALPIGDGTEDFEVAAVYYDYSSERGFVIGHREVLMEYLPDDRLTSLAVYLREGSDADTATSELIAAVSGLQLRVSRNRELRERATEVFDRTFAITYALELVAVFVAILGMAGALLTLVTDRRAELAVFRVLGATRRQLRTLVLAQAGILGLLSNLVGLVLGCALSIVLVKVINKQSFGWTIQFHWPVGLLLVSTTAIFGASLAAGMYPARLAAARKSIKVLHEE